MNIASWIILAILIIWAIFAIRAAFFKGKKKTTGTGKGTLPADESAYKIETSSCGGCDKSSCADCPLARGDIPMPKIRELK